MGARRGTRGRLVAVVRRVPTGEDTDGYMHGVHPRAGDYRVDVNCWVGRVRARVVRRRSRPRTLHAGHDHGRRGHRSRRHLHDEVGDDLRHGDRAGRAAGRRRHTFASGRSSTGSGSRATRSRAGPTATTSSVRWPGATYRVEFDGRGVGLSREFWDGAASVLGADSIVLDPREDVYGIDAQLGSAGAIAGHVRRRRWRPAVGVAVHARACGTKSPVATSTSTTGARARDRRGTATGGIDGREPGHVPGHAGPSGASRATACRRRRRRAWPGRRPPPTSRCRSAPASPDGHRRGGCARGGVRRRRRDRVGRGRVELDRYGDFETDEDGAYTLAPLCAGNVHGHLRLAPRGLRFSGGVLGQPVHPRGGRRHHRDRGRGRGTGIDAALGVEGDTQPPTAPVVIGADGAWHAGAGRTRLLGDGRPERRRGVRVRVDGGAGSTGSILRSARRRTTRTTASTTSSCAPWTSPAIPARPPSSRS